MINTGTSQLRQAFYAHLGVSQKTQGMASNLLLFYAVECGIKSVWLRSNRLHTTNDISDQTLLSKDGHNLDRWRKELRIAASQVSQAPHFRLSSGGSTLDVEKAHQAWRYGIRMDSQDEKVLVEWLENLCDWIKENINR
ncbi:MAG: hypothetical protein F6K47_10550 [Symploca sp. SIO2E6]|nr:hypothetical protein [Symploca sp. SIO2E6]